MESKTGFISFDQIVATLGVCMSCFSCVGNGRKSREVEVVAKELRRLESKTGFVSFDHSWCMYELFFSCWKWEKVEGGRGCDKRASWT